MSWWLIVWLAVAAYAFKAAGLLVLGRYELRGPGAVMAELIPAALLAALVALQTFAIGRSLHLDARAVGLAVAGVAVWRRAPFVVVIVAAAAATAAARALGA